MIDQGILIVLLGQALLEVREDRDAAQAFAKMDPAKKAPTVKTMKGEMVEVIETHRIALRVVAIRKPMWNDLYPDGRVLIMGTRTDGTAEALRVGVGPLVRSARRVIAEMRRNHLVSDPGRPWTVRNPLRQCRPLPGGNRIRSAAPDRWREPFERSFVAPPLDPIE
jgi:hypothetical protein